jgi:hypothetical protein
MKLGKAVYQTEISDFKFLKDRNFCIVHDGHNISIPLDAIMSDGWVLRSDIIEPKLIKGIKKLLKQKDLK